MAILDPNFNIFDLVKDSVDLVSYLEKCGATLIPGHGNIIASTNCVLPNHTNDDTPSLKVYAAGSCHCFGCGGGGDVVSLHQAINNFSRPLEAAQDLVTREYAHLFSPDQIAQASGYGASGNSPTITPEQVQETKEVKNFLGRLATAYSTNLLIGMHADRSLDTRSKGAKEAMSALRERSLNKHSIIKVFRLGYADNTGNVAALTKKENSLKQDTSTCAIAPLSILDKSGSVILDRSGSGSAALPGRFALLRNRIIIPIRDENGEVVAFNGRILATEEAKQLANGKSPAKYINSSTTFAYKKNEVLYGLFENKEAIRTSGIVNVVEGCFDVQSMYRVGTASYKDKDKDGDNNNDSDNNNTSRTFEVANCVAALSSSLTTNQMELLYRHGATKRINLLFDGDAPGRAAALKNLMTIAPAIRDNVPIHIVSLPNGHDPDSFVRSFGTDPKGTAAACMAMSQITKNAPHCTDYFFKLLQEKYPNVDTNAQHRIGFRTQAYEFINKLSGHGNHTGYRTGEQTKREFTQRVETYLGVRRSLGDFSLPSIEQGKELVSSLKNRLNDNDLNNNNNNSDKFAALNNELSRISALQEHITALKELLVDAQATMVGKPLNQIELQTRAGLSEATPISDKPDKPKATHSGRKP